MDLLYSDRNKSLWFPLPVMWPSQLLSAKCGKTAFPDFHDEDHRMTCSGGSSSRSRGAGDSFSFLTSAPSKGASVNKCLHNCSFRRYSSEAISVECARGAKTRRMSLSVCAILVSVCALASVAVCSSYAADRNSPVVLPNGRRRDAGSAQAQSPRRHRERSRVRGIPHPKAYESPTVRIRN